MLSLFSFGSNLFHQNAGSSSSFGETSLIQFTSSTTLYENSDLVFKQSPDDAMRYYQIREAVESGDTSSLLELAFLPMYGNDDNIDRKEFVKEIVKFETELLRNCLWQLLRR